ncbi:membrane-associated, eicosanoid/glutathione metabolism protein [Xylariales sp. AK1849]|nr:membrane-associated, eicosanoid/glutathione metabolism protein [Xylariales sp. AK1849]
MASQIGLNYPVLAPLLPVTGSFAVPFAAYFSFLSLRVVRYRLKDKHYLGDNSSSTSDKSNKLYVASRAHANFVENVPLAFVLATVAELNGGNRKLLIGALSALLTFRVVYTELGMLKPKAMGNGRPIGYFGTIGTILGLAGYTAFLVKDYWGF